mmetsp:Transcript_90195/g.254450  ORF Transcript_90195/g.254450 Transcript_90195/m.254450 type:complete len:297 (+) Transcript_90195:168-1058(+)
MPLPKESPSQNGSSLHRGACRGIGCPNDTGPSRTQCTRVLPDLSLFLCPCSCPCGRLHEFQNDRDAKDACACLCCGTRKNNFGWENGIAGVAGCGFDCPRSDHGRLGRPLRRCRGRSRHGAACHSRSCLGWAIPGGCRRPPFHDAAGSRRRRHRPGRADACCVHDRSGPGRDACCLAHPLSPRRDACCLALPLSPRRERRCYRYHHCPRCGCRCGFGDARHLLRHRPRPADWASLSVASPLMLLRGQRWQEGRLACRFQPLVRFQRHQLPRRQSQQDHSKAVGSSPSGEPTTVAPS